MGMDEREKGRRGWEETKEKVGKSKFFTKTKLQP